MKKMKNLSVSLLCLLILGACNPKKSGNSSNGAAKTTGITKGNLDIEAIKKQIDLQKGMENNDAPDNQVHFLDQKDIELSLSVIEEGLAQAGYKTPDKADFEKKIKEIYNCENGTNAAWKGTSTGYNMTPESWITGTKFIDYYSDRYGETERKSYHMVA